MTPLTIQSGPAPLPRPKQDRRSELRRQFEAMRNGQWVAITVASIAEYDRIRRCAEHAGCWAYWKDDTSMVAKKGGKKK